MSSPVHVRRLGLSPGEWTVVAFTIAYVAPAFVVSIQRGNHEFLLYVLVLAVLSGLVLLLHRRVGLQLASLWGLSLWGLAHMAGGLASIPQNWPVSPGAEHVLYNWWIIPGALKYDQCVHAFGFGLTTWICWQALRRAFLNRGLEVAPTAGLLLLCAAAGMGFGALNEVVEFAATLLMPETNVGGYENTGWDLVSNLAGSLLAAVILYFFDRPQLSR